jgi:two-component system cell cycle response regulator DivK
VFRLKNKHIVLIEDNPSNLAVMTTILQMEGAKTGFERWGTTTIARLYILSPIDLILLDLMFPNGVTGWDIFKEIRANTEFANVPVVAVSAMDAALAIPKARELGFAGFIAKPIDIDLFPAQLVKLINREPVWQAQPMRR